MPISFRIKYQISFISSAVSIKITIYKKNSQFKMYKLVLCLLIASFACINADINDAHAEIVKLDSDLHDGAYEYSYETSNGISVQESGLGGHIANGEYSYISPEGEHIAVKYVADENGFQPSGEVLPTPPPIPYQIAEALEYIRSHPQYEN